MNKLQRLQQELENAAGSIDELSGIFFNHSRTSFLNDYFARELTTMAGDANYMVGGISGQLNLKLINTDQLDYTVHLRLSSTYKPNVKWMGISQLMAVKGPGKVEVRVLRVPAAENINAFREKIQVEIVSTHTLLSGDTLICQAPYEIMEIMTITDSVILEILTIKDEHVNLFWNFGTDLLSTYPESSSLVMSRLTTILNVIHRMNVPAPEGLYDFIFQRGDANLKLKGLSVLLKEGQLQAFDKLNEFIEADDPLLSTGASVFLDRLLEPSTK